MELSDFITEIKNWRLSKYKIINFAIGLIALLIYEFIGRPIYRPYIYQHKINDFHIADTLGNTFGTIPTLFFLVVLFSTEIERGQKMIKLGTISVVIFELVHPFLGKPIDIWDIVATCITGFISYHILNLIFKKN